MLICQLGAASSTLQHCNKVTSLPSSATVDTRHPVCHPTVSPAEDSKRSVARVAAVLVPAPGCVIYYDIYCAPQESGPGLGQRSVDDYSTAPS